MMRPTHINPKISADTYLQGTHDFNKVPLAPPGILTVIQKSPNTRETYASHGLKGWYVGGAPHLIAGLVFINPNFPLHLWCRLIPQCEQTLNMMRPTHINPKISADTYLQGTHDFNKVPLAPPGILTVIHESPNTRETYALHSLKG